MRIGVLSDTHGHVVNTRKAVEVFARQGVERLIHCGDIGSAEVVRLLARWPADYVFGNVDHDARALSVAIEAAGQVSHGQFADLTLAGRRVAVLHGHDFRRLQETTACGDYDLVCHGHTHVVDKHFQGNALILNPGALFRAPRHTVAIVELPSRSAEIVDLD